MKLLLDQLFPLIDDLSEEYSIGYVVMALKQISDQQLLHISFKDHPIQNDPILKVYDLMVEEIEAILFKPPNGISSNLELKQCIEQVLLHIKQEKL